LRLRNVYLKGAAALAAVAALLAIATVLKGDFGETEGKIFATIAATFVAGSCVMAGIACLAHGSRLLGRAGIALAAGGFLLWSSRSGPTTTARRTGRCSASSSSGRS
jgi:hypothetical protein